MAANSERLSASLQENLLVLLTFSDKHAATIRNTVDEKLFGSAVYREVAARIYDYLDKYHKPPADYLPDLLEDELAKDKPSAEMYAELLTAIHGQRESIKHHEQYILNQLTAFVRQQSLKQSIIRASEAIQENDLDRASVELEKGLKQRLHVFAPGIGLAEGMRAAFRGDIRTDVVPLGISQLDDAQLGPGRGELHLFLGPPKRGKSMWLVHVAKQCVKHHHKTLYITLELSERQIAQRLMQSMFSLTRTHAKVEITRIRKDDLGRLLRVESEKMSQRLSFDDVTNRPKIEKKLMRYHGRENIVIKQFPASSLTVQGLENYLDMLEQVNGFVPDFIVLDYPKYMKIDVKNYRIESGVLYDQLRGLAVSRNVGVIVASESNRDGAKSRMLTNEHAGEDYSKIYTADTILTYSQTQVEKEMGLARIFASASRVGGRDGFVVLISQAYPVCQFVIDSCYMADAYWAQLEQATATTRNKLSNTDEEEAA